jgi:hypothetical protein
LLFYFVLQLLPQAQPFFVNELIRDYSANKLLHTVFLNPITYQLWFLRDLMAIVLISPIIYWLIKYLKFFPVLILLITWLFNFDLRVISNESLFFFVTGAYFSIDKKNFLLKDFSANHRILTGIWITLVLCKTILVFNGVENSVLLNIVHKTTILTGIPAVWSLYDFFMKNKSVSDYKLFSLTTFTFFLYVFHEPVLTIFKKGLFYFIGKSELASISIYFIAALFTISVSFFVGYYFKRIAPGVYGLETGGR